MTLQPAIGSDREWSVGELKDYGGCSDCDFSYEPCPVHEPKARALWEARVAEAQRGRIRISFHRSGSTATIDGKPVTVEEAVAALQAAADEWKAQRGG